MIGDIATADTTMRTAYDTEMCDLLITLSNGEKIYFHPFEYGEWDDERERKKKRDAAVADLKRKLTLFLEDEKDLQALMGAL